MKKQIIGLNFIPDERFEKMFQGLQKPVDKQYGGGFFLSASEKSVSKMKYSAFQGSNKLKGLYFYLLIPLHEKRKVVLYYLPNLNSNIYNYVNISFYFIVYSFSPFNITFISKNSAILTISSTVKVSLCILLEKLCFVIHKTFAKSFCVVCYLSSR